MKMQEDKEEKKEKSEERKHLVGEYLTFPTMAVNMIRADKKIKPLKYEFDKNKAQYILYFPPQLKPEEKAKKYLVVYIYGGGWKAGNPNLYKFVGRAFAKEKYHTILLGYRLTPKYQYPNQIDDVFSGFNKALSILKEKNIDYSNIIVVGSSAGAHLGALLVYNKELQKKYNVDASIFKGYISLGGPINFDVCVNKRIASMIDQLIGDSKEYTLESVNPYNYIDGTEKTKVLCVHSEIDPICEVDNAITFSNKINSFNKDLAKCIVIENKNIFHNDLVNGIFFDKMDRENIFPKVIEWIEEI